MLYERIYNGPGEDTVKVEPRPLVFEDVATQATALLREVNGELRSVVGEAKQGQEFRLRSGDRLWIWRPINTSNVDEEISHGLFITPLEALTLFMAMGRYTDDKLNPGLDEMPDEYERSRRMIKRLHEMVNKHFGGGS